MLVTNKQPALDTSSLFADLPVPVRVRIGERVMTLDEMSALDLDSTIAFGTPVGETLDVMVGNVRLASGEIVVLEDRLAIRITELQL
jgi:flagellar motor switch protein FliN/FliY